MSRVYLAGPIAGCDWKGATGWREEAQDQLNAVGIEAFSPMRAKEFLHHVKRFNRHGYTENPLSTQKGIVTRDRNDVMKADVVLVNFADATEVSIGTVMEIAWADAYRVPVVCILPENNPHVHGMLLECSGYRVNTLEEALAVVKAILLE